MFGAGGVSALWQCVGGAAAPDAVCGADAGGRVSPGADQPGHTGCGHWGGDRDTNVLEHIRVELVHVCVGKPGCMTAELAVQPACADLNRPHCGRAAGFKSDDGESEAPFTLKLQIFLIFCSAQKAAESHFFKS